MNCLDVLSLFTGDYTQFITQVVKYGVVKEVLIRRGFFVPMC